MTATQLLRSILAELDLPAPRDRVRCLETLNGFLLERVAAGEEVVLLIDEAQDLSRELLEQVRLLSNLETDQRKLLQIVLVGQPELRALLDERGLRQLRQRITVRYHLSPLSPEETESYIRFRVQVAGGNARPTFNRWALRGIYRYSHGVPRLINAVCDKTLLCGYVLGTDRLLGRHVRRAVRELEGRSA
jgi:general secretion pathway protein A